MQFHTDPLSRLAAAKLAADRAGEELEAAKAEVVKYLADRKTKSISRVDSDGFKRTFTVSRRTEAVIDEDGLRAVMGDEFQDYVIEKLDKKKLEEAIEVGKVDKDVVAPLVTVKQGKPYVIYTESSADESE